MASFSCYFFIFPNMIQRIGSLLTVLGAGYLAYQLRLNQLQEKDSTIAAAEMGNAAPVAFYRAKLQRQIVFHSGLWFWSRLAILVPGPLLFIVGTEIVHPRLATFMGAEGLAFLFFVALSVPLNLRKARRYQRHISELDAIQTEPQ